MIESNYYKKKMCEPNCEYFNSCNCKKDFERKENKKMKLEELACKTYKRNREEIEDICSKK